MATRLLIIDDSAVVRKVLSKSLGQHPQIEVVGTAPDPLVASEKIERLRPHVLTLDMEMPRMDGMTFLKGLMRHHPLPVIIVSSITPKGGRLALEALHAGAVEVVCKPGSAYSADSMAKDLAEKIVAVGSARVSALNNGGNPLTRAPIADPLGNTADAIVAIGASTGGTKALERVLSQLPQDFPGTLVVQHMPPIFTRSFAERLNENCLMEVKEAQPNDSVIPGRVLIAPGDRHLMLARSGGRRIARVVEGPRVKRQKPSVEVLFDSVATHAGANAIGVILTGMGDDGAEGMLAMKKHGAFNIAQDEASCIVFGMPKEAISKGGVDQVLPLDNIPNALIRQVRQRVS